MRCWVDGQGATAGSVGNETDQTAPAGILLSGEIILMQLIVFCQLFPNFLAEAKQILIPIRNTKCALIVPSIHELLALLPVEMRVGKRKRGNNTP